MSLTVFFCSYLLYCSLKQLPLQKIGKSMLQTNYIVENQAEVIEKLKIKNFNASGNPSSN